MWTSIVARGNLFHSLILCSIALFKIIAEQYTQQKGHVNQSNAIALIMRSINKSNGSAIFVEHMQNTINALTSYYVQRFWFDIWNESEQQKEWRKHGKIHKSNSEFFSLLLLLVEVEDSFD